ncbi:hypothetical protein [Bradyrhizobium erythrophlei]|jgi:hypothetical protein|uniref:Uncharacterized protein n=1 Tax=Bradyrhizobium erythrophlei TaxID=1437360 RepID=A0A1M5YUG5_9BRAD|nr:hypothetical protein [Bradyrhizobium erythrophlei]SHI15498.1 hypothetical protein SAMN05443248_8781 [Bradyrhizobium erythrophlei]
MVEKEPLHWTPKLLAFQEARDLYDYEMIQIDLRFAKSCFDQISNREYGVGFPGGLDRNDSHGIDWCIFVAGALCYRRCFKTGARSRLLRNDLVDRVPDELLSLHDTIIAITDKNLAHSVNEMEAGCSNLQIAIDSKNCLHRGGVGWSSSGIGPLGPTGYRALSGLIDKIIQAILDEKLRALKLAVNNTVSQMTDEEILALPAGFSPHINEPRYDKPRRWPKL